MNDHLDVVAALLAAGANTDAVNKVPIVSFVNRIVSFACGLLEWMAGAVLGF
jgi:hypothetical protein